VIYLLDEQAREKLVVVIPKYSKECREELILDTTRFQQIILNLMQNAIKFSYVKQAVQLSARVFKTEEGQDKLKVTIEDSGIGIKEDQLASIFEPFYQ
jgi:signal transduction histidine kinase